MTTIDHNDFPTIQSRPILNGNASALFGNPEDVPEVARLLQAQGLIMAEERQKVRAAEEALERARAEHEVQWKRYDTVSAYLHDLIRNSATEALRDRQKS